jgi:hypothetical protein
MLSQRFASIFRVEIDTVKSLKSKCVAGLLDTITSTADSKDCPGVCVHTLATLICYEVLEDVVCPSPSMRCCVEPPPSNSSLPPLKGEAQNVVTSVSSTGQPTRRPQVRTSICFLFLFSCGLFNSTLKDVWLERKWQWPNLRNQTGFC